MSKRSIRDEVELLQAHEEHAQGLVNLIQDGVIDLDLAEDSYQKKSITNALETLLIILDRAITNRDQQLTTDTDPRLEHGYFAGHDR